MVDIICIFETTTKLKLPSLKVAQRRQESLISNIILQIIQLIA